MGENLHLVKHFGRGGAFPTANQLAAVTVNDLKRDGGLGYRAAYIHELATAVSIGKLELESLKTDSRSSEELYRFLRSLKGIGDYAASSLLMLLGCYDRVPVDSIAKALVSKEFFAGQSVTPAQIRQSFAQFGDYAALAYWCWQYKEDES